MTENLRIVKGEPTSEELAALVAVLAAAQASAQQDDKVVAEWNSPHRTIRQPIHYGPNMWRRSVLPQ